MVENTRCSLVWAALVAFLAGPTLASELSNLELGKRLGDYLAVAEEQGFSGTVLAVRGGEILLEKGYGVANVATRAKVRTDSVFTTGSITKQFTAAAILELDLAGKLSVDDPISKYFDQVPDDKSAITLHHLLTHSAGFEGAIGDDFERICRDEYVERALVSALLFEPGTSYGYSNVGYSLLAAIVEKTSGVSYEVFLQKSFFAPAGMKDTGYALPGWDEDRLAHGVTDEGGDWGTVFERAIASDGPGWNLVGNGGIHSTLGDMYRWHLALESGKVLPREVVERMYTPWVEEPGGTHYGYGWSIETTERDTRLIAHNGGNPYFFADFWRFLDEDVVLYFATNSRDRRFQDLMPALASIVFHGEAEPLAPKSIAIEGPSAATGTAAARWGLPNDPRGHAAARFLDALSLESKEERQSFIEAAFASDVIERNGIEVLSSILVNLREELGDFELRGLAAFGEHGAEIQLFSGQDQVDFRIQMDLEDEEPFRILGLSIEAE